MSKHTPGPWEPCSDGHVIDIRPVGKSESGTVTRLYPSVPLGQRWADARLIAAAPEMLKALHVAERALERYEATEEAPDDHPSLDLVRAAIARAEGRD